MKDLVLQKELQKKSFQILKKLLRSCGVFQPIIIVSSTGIEQWSLYFSEKANHLITKLKSKYLCKGNDDD